jgi:hypothetical protein
MIYYSSCRATVKVVKTVLQNMAPRLGAPSHGQHCNSIPYSSITIRKIKHSADVLHSPVVIKRFAHDVGSNHGGA